MQKWRLESIAVLLNNCADIALKYFDAPGTEFKVDRSLVTEADKEIEKYLSDYFINPAKNVYMIGEETVFERDEEYISSALKNTAWVVDPIDGTAPYANHLSGWGISIALMKNSKILDGAIYLPLMNQMFITNGPELLFSDNKGRSFSKVETVASTMSSGGIISISQKMSKHGKFKTDNPVQTLSCCVASVGNLILGRFAAYVASVKIWDIAAGIAMLERLKYPIQVQDGTEVNSQINEKVYYLNKSDGLKRWRVRGHLIIAVNKDDISCLTENSVFP